MISLFKTQLMKTIHAIFGGKWDPSPPLHKLEVIEETSPSRIQPNQGARVKMKDPGFHYTA
ncbi:unnamed protein product [Spirodela intermedia]|uniref:Uncharacterized protein n=2 Tax=Spirodela intermedia TaxID=51605 RepID=A0A7I8IBQ6_SPIIN|nr:unnamed protein product [Spirodela intermedia]CAA6655018.1 unnamed protein product [Spirodela intermedia]CAA7389737.1 unnamed protein product [Spirodela intermedia]